MHALGKAAVVGAVIGMAEALLQLHGPDDFTGVVFMLLTPVVLGLLLNWAIALPRWGAVAVVAPFVNIALILVGFGRMTFVEVMDLGVGEGNAIFMMIGASGNVVAAALVGPGSQVLRSVAAGAVAVGFLGVTSHQGTIAGTAQVRRLESSDVPLIALRAKDYELTTIAEQPAGWAPPTMELLYERLSDGAELEVYVMPPGAATPEAACREPVPHFSHVFGEAGTCRKVWSDVWVRTEDTYARVFALREGGLVQLASQTVPENDLITLVGAFRQVMAEELAAVK
ncbi:hypothetical protein ETD86_01570 [Nonomuraea turkmeniaca]|uniref:Uncharacterized protein n=1 Tax=Nonomuraea turkmeniaca TaxID=103838 RepID=A0A5S4GGJ3_9ACTN|nr:hypothetical protein [Nonomuraea turkmeniaca]TMR25310.1 hypothetical protein ETD86_01570 [Nonomuraea turkmeniaca]